MKGNATKRLMTSFVAAALLCSARWAYANWIIDEMNANAPTGIEVDPYCTSDYGACSAFQYWAGWGMTIGIWIEELEGNMSDPGFGQWCSMNFEECQEYYTFQTELYDASAYAYSMIIS
jgi:hypothetical protein